MSIQFRPAKREKIPLILGLAGGTGSGKTYSAMLLAQGISNGEPFAVIDTENGRARHYADTFKFDDHQLRAPFRPEAYTEAIQAADQTGEYPVIVVDSMSHEYAGDGGLLDWQADEFQRMGARDAVKMASWIAPKMAHKQFVSGLLQLRSHLILCFRAEEKIEIAKEGGKTVVRPKQSLTGLDGWMPVTEKNLPYELTASCLLLASAPGVPQPIKLQEQHRPFVPLDKPLDATVGRRLAEWAAGTGEVERALEGELLALAERLEKAEQTKAAVDKHRKQHPGTHARWLQSQIEIANAVLAEREPQPDEEALFEQGAEDRRMVG